MNTNEKAGADRLKELGEKYDVAGSGVAMALFALEHAISNCPEELISDADLTAALAMHLAKRIAHNGHEQLAREFMDTSVEIITESKSSE